MEAEQNRTSLILPFLAVVNQLHRLCSSIPVDALPAGMTMSQLAVISYLHFRGEEETYQKDLETCLKLRRSTVSSLLSTLERKGLLIRVSVPHDARLKKIILTENASQLGRQIHAAFSALDFMMFQDLTPEEIHLLDSVFQKIQNNLSTIENCSSPDPLGGNP
ncbi:MAG: MarR family transcriptional regulator [Ruminiclostridium sp.]|nr:MarR family transcriptional regulator [Ruminiclostridium sp.]